VRFTGWRLSPKPRFRTFAATFVANFVEKCPIRQSLRQSLRQRLRRRLKTRVFGTGCSYKLPSLRHHNIRRLILWLGRALLRTERQRGLQRGRTPRRLAPPLSTTTASTPATTTNSSAPTSLNPSDTSDSPFNARNAPGCRSEAEVPQPRPCLKSRRDARQ